MIPEIEKQNIVFRHSYNCTCVSGKERLKKSFETKAAMLIVLYFNQVVFSQKMYVAFHSKAK